MDIKTKPSKSNFKNRKNIGCFIIFILPFFVISVVSTGLGIFYGYKSFESISWSKTQAFIDRVELKSHYGKGTVTYQVIIQYRYKNRGKTLLGDNLAFAYGNNNIEDHQRLFDLLSRAKRIMVRINPENVKESVIIPGFNDSLVFIFIFSVCWNSLLGFFYSSKSYKQRGEHFYCSIYMDDLFGFTVQQFNSYPY